MKEIVKKRKKKMNKSMALIMTFESLVMNSEYVTNCHYNEKLFQLCCNYFAIGNVQSNLNKLILFYVYSESQKMLHAMMKR